MICDTTFLSDLQAERERRIAPADLLKSASSKRLVALLNEAPLKTWLENSQEVHPKLLSYFA
jgi:hypothetical protein